VQITPICVTLAGSNDTREDAPNGGCARVLSDLPLRRVVRLVAVDKGRPRSR